MEQEVGIENLKKVVILAASVWNKVSLALQDNKYTFAEMLTLVPDLAGIGDIVQSKDAIVNEAKNLTLPKVKDLIASVDAQISDKVILAKIENAINAAVSISVLIQDYTTKAAAQVTAVG
jgi:hypothetical protein